MTPQIIMVLGRNLVLVIAALTGPLSIYLGWKLYRDSLPSSVQGEGTFNNWQFKLSAAGPGVFFAAFGMWIIIHLIGQQIEVNNADTISVPQKSNAVFDAGEFRHRALWSVASTSPAPTVCILQTHTSSIRGSTGQPRPPTPDSFRADIAFARSLMLTYVYPNFSSLDVQDQERFDELLGTFDYVAGK